MAGLTRPPPKDACILRWHGLSKYSDLMNGVAYALEALSQQPLLDSFSSAQLSNRVHVHLLGKHNSPQSKADGTHPLKFFFSYPIGSDLALHALQCSTSGKSFVIQEGD